MESILNNLPEPNESLLGAVNTLANSAPDEEQSLLNNINAAANELTGEPIVLGQKKLTHEEQAKIIFENYIQNMILACSSCVNLRSYSRTIFRIHKGSFPVRRRDVYTGNVCVMQRKDVMNICSMKASRLRSVNVQRKHSTK